jgi:glycosyltransferase involved in cell wall biosynthesis
MNILFILNSRFTGNALSHRPLGGTETALIGVSSELARLPGSRVAVCADTDRPGRYDDVDYIPLAHLAQWAEHNTVDVVISIRDWLPLWLPIPARHRIYFSPDAYDQPALQSAVDATLRIDGQLVTSSILSPSAFFDGVDQFFCVGRWQAGTFASELGIPEDRIFVTGNAIVPERFNPLPLAERNNAIVYSATPFRGLALMPDYYRYLKSEQPGLGFEVCSGMGVYGHSKARDEEAYGQLYHSLKETGADLHGSVLQHRLAEIMCRSRVYTYPNTFAETFCISVLEAQAAGLPVVTSRRGAMPERIEHGVDGFLVDGEPGSERYTRDFLQTTLRLLRDDELWREINTAAVTRASTQSYRNLAQSWQDNFSRALAGSVHHSLPDIPASLPTRITHPTRAGEHLELPPRLIRQFLEQEFRRFGFHPAGG